MKGGIVLINDQKKWYIKFYVYPGKRGFPSVRANLPIEIFRRLLGEQFNRYSKNHKVVGMAYIDNQWRLVIQIVQKQFKQDNIEKELEDLIKFQDNRFNQFKIDGGE